MAVRNRFEMASLQKDIDLVSKSVWNAIKKCIDEVTSSHVLNGFNLRMCIGNGQLANFWFDPWHDGTPLAVSFPRLLNLENNKLCKVIDRVNIPIENYSWRRMPRGGVESSQLHSFMNIVNHVQIVDECDQWCWDGFNFGSYNVSQARKMIDKVDHASSTFPTLWCRYVPIRFKVFIWRLRLRRLPTKLNLLAKGLDFDNGACSMCSNCLEDDLHIFVSCDTTKLLWRQVGRWIMDIPLWSSIDGIWSWVDGVPISDKKRITVRAIIISTLWYIWRLRNSIVFKDSKFKNGMYLIALLLLTLIGCMQGLKRVESIGRCGYKTL
ncbi:uncharacterized protein [Rutidosis leptorrhynchoides]|uniref:uncharacterized protein n=1 Tax=Rutidosis leptorrhynchoides TaxID=125765 RepID=UPI003A9A337B